MQVCRCGEASLAQGHKDGLRSRRGARAGTRVVRPPTRRRPGRLCSLSTLWFRRGPWGGAGERRVGEEKGSGALGRASRPAAGRARCGPSSRAAREHAIARRSRQLGHLVVAAIVIGGQLAAAHSLQPPVGATILHKGGLGGRQP